jgi:tRNA(Ile)-lysidine synthase
MPVQPPPLVRRKKQTKIYSVHKNKNLPELPDEIKPIIDSVDRFIQSTLFIPDEASIVIGLSGGVDSTVMLDIIATISLKRGYQITVAHCNHGLRGNESENDEKHARWLAGGYRAQFRSAKYNVAEYARNNKTSVENAARILRYQFFERTARSVGARFVLTAHNADDSAETLLLNLLRGSGLTGLAGMPPRRDIAKKIHLVRPLLQLPKARLREYAEKRNLEWREDSSNASNLFMRNKIRHDLLPKLRDEYTPAIADILVRTTRILQGAEAVVSERVEQLSATMIRQTGNEIRLGIAFFDTVNDFLKGEIVQSIVKKLGSQPVSMGTVDRIIALTHSDLHAECRVTGAITAVRDRTEIVFSMENVAEVYANIGVAETVDVGIFALRLSGCTKKEVKLGTNPAVEYFDASLLPKQLTIRTWREGDNFRPLGLGGSMKISDFLTNSKVSVVERKRIVVLCAGSEIIWVCGMRISDSFKITSATKHIIRAEIIVPPQSGEVSGIPS